MAELLTKEGAAEILGFDTVEEMEEEFLAEEVVPALCSECIEFVKDEDAENYDESKLIDPDGKCEHGFPSIVHDC